MGCGSSREETASWNNVFRKEVDAFIAAEEPNGEIPRSEVARLTLCRSLHVQFRRDNLLTKVWRAYSNHNLCPNATSTMSFLQLQTMTVDILVCDKDTDRILHERHMTGDKSATTFHSLTSKTAQHQMDLTVGLRKSKDKSEGYLNVRNAKIKQILNNENRLHSLCKKIFKELDGRLERSTVDSEGVATTKVEVQIGQSTFLHRFRIDMIIDTLNVKTSAQ